MTKLTGLSKETDGINYTFYRHASKAHIRYILPWSYAFGHGVCNTVGTEWWSVTWCKLVVIGYVELINCQFDSLTRLVVDAICLRWYLMLICVFCLSVKYFYLIYACGWIQLPFVFIIINLCPTYLIDPKWLHHF